MNSSRALIGSVLSLALGLALIFIYCNGNVGFRTGTPLSGTTLQVSITTTGYPAIAGLILLVIGLILMAWALLGAIAAQFAAPAVVAEKTSHG